MTGHDPTYTTVFIFFWKNGGNQPTTRGPELSKIAQMSCPSTWGLSLHVESGKVATGTFALPSRRVFSFWGREGGHWQLCSAPKPPASKSHMIFLVSSSRRFFLSCCLGAFIFSMQVICGKSWHVPHQKARMMVWWRFGDWTQSQRIGRMLGRLGSRKRGEAVPVRWGEENVCVFFWNS